MNWKTGDPFRGGFRFYHNGRGTVRLSECWIKR
jgi:hypothetical protein